MISIVIIFFKNVQFGLQTCSGTCMYRVSARHQSPSGWGTNRGHIVVVEDDTFIR